MSPERNVITDPPPYFVALWSLGGLHEAWVHCKPDLDRIAPAGVVLQSTYDDLFEFGTPITHMVRSLKRVAPDGSMLPPPMVAWALSADEGHPSGPHQVQRRVMLANIAQAAGVVMVILDCGDRWERDVPGFTAADAAASLTGMRGVAPKMPVIVAGPPRPREFMAGFAGLDGYIAKAHFGRGALPADPNRWGADRISSGSLGVLPAAEPERIRTPITPVRVLGAPVFTSLPGGGAHHVDMLRVADRSPWTVVWTLCPNGHNTMRLDAEGEKFIAIQNALRLRGYNGEGRAEKFERIENCSFDKGTAQAALLPPPPVVHAPATSKPGWPPQPAMTGTAVTAAPVQAPTVHMVNPIPYIGPDEQPKTNGAAPSLAEFESFEDDHT